ncbi:MAG: carboxypeptidase regulatory-like domain-containing protein [Acidobacteria bacterium]|nr:carboxypeptidase regulatory-like domain-containing protein [Acidobacteriota bacterium]MBI3663637.1 carboxypeptidase regulatory-like domain-containing protein [Acidobacteriota bacterium]
MQREVNHSKAQHWVHGTAILLLGLGVFLLPVLMLAQSGGKAAKEKEGVATKLRIEVTAGEGGDPVEGASVYVRYEEERKFGKDKKIEQNWKTNKEGVVKVPAVPRGKVLIQVIAPGWKTFGQWYDLDQEEQTIKIRLQKPPRWY